MAKKALYLTTTLPYVNAEPHIGFALEMVQADIYARYRRLMGDEVFFNTGTDEHGQKIYQKAKEEKRDVQEYVDDYASRFGKLKDALNLSYDAFIRTTDKKHVAAAQELWKRCEKDIYKKKYKGLYCVGDEAFIKESDLVNGMCPNHPTMKPEVVEEENYFFKLTNYQKDLETYLSKEQVIVPEWRRQEALNFVKAGLEDFSISRVKEKMPWGIPVPGDESQVMYVWFDALTNYISTLDWPDGANFKKFWEKGETLQLAGKDQVRFQSIMWQAMLLSAGIKPTDKVVYHGFITSGGQKMSKSLGNVIDPMALVQEYGTDAVRYFLARHVHPFEDSDVTLEHFKEAYNADLANGLGNLTARIMTLAETYFDSPVDVPDISLTDDGGVGLTRLKSFDFQNHLNDIWGGLDQISWFANIKDVEAYNQTNRVPVSSILGINQSITMEEPFKKIKSNSVKDVNEAKEAIRWLVIQLWYKSLELEPFMPKTARLIQDSVRHNKKPTNLFPRKE